MSFFRGNGLRKSAKKRKYPSSEEHKEVKYDDLKNAFFEVWKDMKVNTKLLKSCKPRNPEQPINLQDVLAYVLNTYLKHASKLNHELGIEFDEVKEERKKLEDEIERLKVKHSDEIAKLNDDIDYLNRQHKIEIDRIRKEHYDEMKNYKQKVKESQERIKSLEAMVKKVTDEKEKQQNQVKNLSAELENVTKEKEKNTNHTITALEKENEKLRQENQKKDQEYYALKQHAAKIERDMHNSQKEAHSLQDENSRKNRNIQQLTTQLNEERDLKEDEKKQKDEALTRLSAIAGDRLRNNNPGITDLSDPNRPMKIAEKFTEMYDNDWTDAMEALEDQGLEEEKCVEILLHFLTDSYEECGRRVTQLDNFIGQAVLLPSADSKATESGDASDESQDIPAELSKPIKDLRRKLTQNNIDVLQKILPNYLKEKRNLTLEQLNGCKDFVNDCIKYAWMMQIQDPPVFIEWEFPKETKIDTNILRSYTKAGEIVDFIVWPVLYLHKDGPVLNKGVVQPIPKK